MFNTNDPFVVEIKSGGLRRAVVRYPTDAEIIARAEELKYIRKQKGDESRPDLTNTENFDGKLFPKMREAFKDRNTDEFDEYEANAAIDLLLATKMIDSKDNGDTAVIELEVFGSAEAVEGEDLEKPDLKRNRVKFTLRTPRRKDLVDHANAKYTVSSKPRGREMETTTVISVAPSVKLFDKLFVESEGYGEGSRIPANHKDAAIVELVQLMGED
jgi:hypothetical protein